MKKIKDSKTIGSVHELLKASRKASREEEFSLLGPGFHRKTVAFANKKAYTRKVKHKKGDMP